MPTQPPARTAACERLTVLPSTSHRAEFRTVCAPYSVVCFSSRLPPTRPRLVAAVLPHVATSVRDAYGHHLDEFDPARALSTASAFLEHMPCRISHGAHEAAAARLRRVMGSHWTAADSALSPTAPSVASAVVLSRRLALSSSALHLWWQYTRSSTQIVQGAECESYRCAACAASGSLAS